MLRREFLQVLAAAAAAGFALDGRAATAPAAVEQNYNLPRYGNVHLLHFTDCHAQLLPIWFREPDTHIGTGSSAGKPPHLTGERLLRTYALKPGSAMAYACTHLDFENAARTYGRMGGFAHLATLINMLRASRPGALLLDGGDTWQGSATALYTRGQDMVDAAKLLGVNVMTGHWEFTYGVERLQQVLERDFKGHIDFVARNVTTLDFDDAVFTPYVLREMNGVPVAIIGQAFPYVPVAHPARFVPDWRFGIRDVNLQRTVDEVRARGARVVVLLSHNGMDVDLKLASRVRGMDVILGGHTHDALPAPVIVGSTLVANSGCNGKFLSVLDFDVRNNRIQGYRYKLLPVFANLLAPDAAMQAYIERAREPYLKQLTEPLAVTEGLLYRRGNFNGTWDQLILDALMETQDAEIGFSPGFRFGPSLLPGETITMEALMAECAITYPQVNVREMRGAAIKALLEDVCDNLFNPDPYYQQGGDMVRVGGLRYTCAPNAKMGQRIQNLRLAGRPLDADKTYKVAGWAPLADDAAGEPVWDVVAAWLRARKTVTPRHAMQPRVA
ncbi:MAG: thiosulfohydrolase SoxB [Rhodocyclaceae bacterium]|nr:thiosulfohydrolase SoxB [Rhodocyclaceae bacterium]